MNDGLLAAGVGARQRARFRRFRAGLGILLSLVCVAWLIFTMDWPVVWETLHKVDYFVVAAALLLNLTSVLCRTARWRLMFRDPQAPPFGRLIAALLAGQAMNVLIPARLGDLARATLADPEKTPFVLGTLVVEVSLDLVMLASLVLLLLSQATLPAWWRGSGHALLATSAAALVAMAALVVARQWVAGLLERLAARWRHPLVQRGLAMGGQLLRSLDTLGQPAQALPALAWSVCIWALYGAVNYVLLAAVGLHPSMLAALFLLAILQLGVAVPSSPGRIGVFHYLCVQGLAVFGVEGPQALSYAVILHLISVVVPMVLGAVLASRLGVLLWGPPASTVES